MQRKKKEEIGLLIFGKRGRFENFWQGGFLRNKHKRVIGDIIAPLNLFVLRLRAGQDVVGYYKMTQADKTFDVLTYYRYAEDAKTQGNSDRGRPSIFAFALVVPEKQYPDVQFVTSLFATLKESLVYKSSTSYQIPEVIEPQIHNTFYVPKNGEQFKNGLYFNADANLHKHISFLHTDYKLEQVIGNFYRQCYQGGGDELPYKNNIIYLSNYTYKQLINAQAGNVEVYCEEFELKKTPRTPNTVEKKSIRRQSSKRQPTINESFRQKNKQGNVLQTLEIVNDEDIIHNPQKDYSVRPAVVVTKEKRPSINKGKPQKSPETEERETPQVYKHTSETRLEEVITSFFRRYWVFCMAVALLFVGGVTAYNIKEIPFGKGDNKNVTEDKTGRNKEEGEQKESSEGKGAETEAEQSRKYSFSSSSIKDLEKALYDSIQKINRDKEIGNKSVAISKLITSAIARFVVISNREFDKPYSQLRRSLQVPSNPDRENPTIGTQIETFKAAVDSYIKNYHLSTRNITNHSKLTENSKYCKKLYNYSLTADKHRKEIKSYSYISHEAYEQDLHEFYLSHKINNLNTEYHKKLFNNDTLLLVEIREEFFKWRFVNNEYEKWIEWLYKAKEKKNINTVLAEIDNSRSYSSEFLNYLKRDIRCIISDPKRRRKYLKKTVKPLANNINGIQKSYIYPIEGFASCYLKATSKDDVSSCFNDYILANNNPTLNYFPILSDADLRAKIYQQCTN